MQWKLILHISKLKNGRFRCVKSHENNLLEERTIVENSFLTLTSKSTYPKSLGLLKRGIMNMRVSGSGI